MGKVATPDWVKEGFDSKADWEKNTDLIRKKVRRWKKFSN